MRDQDGEREKTPNFVTFVPSLSWQIIALHAHEFDNSFKRKRHRLFCLFCFRNLGARSGLVRVTRP